MGKKKKKKKKKVSIKREKYAKFRKDKPAIMDIAMPELTPEEQKQKQNDELSINKFLRFNRSPPPRVMVKRKEKSKR